jgi:hypothetical protein
MRLVVTKHEGGFRVSEPSRRRDISFRPGSRFSGDALPADALGGQAGSRPSALQVAW